MPDTEGDVCAYLRMITSLSAESCVAIIEDQTGCAGTLVSAPAMFKFGRNFGFILGVLMASGCRIELVLPRKWQGALSLGTKDKSLQGSQRNTAWKNKCKALAQRLYPNLKVTLATADALLLLEYYRRTNP